MNIEETKEAIKVMQAFVDGRQVQVQTHAEWKDVDSPLWEWFESAYRIKPEPKEIWVNEYENGDLGGCHASREDALRYARQFSPRRTVRYREVIEE